MKRVQSKDYDTGTCRMQILHLVMITKNIYLKTDTIGFHIFINLLVDHAKNNFAEYRQFI